MRKKRNGIKKVFCFVFVVFWGVFHFWIKKYIYLLFQLSDKPVKCIFIFPITSWIKKDIYLLCTSIFLTKQ